MFILHPVTLSVIGRTVGSSRENTYAAVDSSLHRILPGRSAAGRLVTSGGSALAAWLVWLVGVIWLILCRWSCLTDFKCKGCRSWCVVSGFPRIKFTKIKLGFDCVGAYKWFSRLHPLKYSGSIFPYRNYICIRIFIIIEMNITLQLVLVNALHSGNDIKILFLCSQNFFRKLHSGRPVHSR